MEAETVTPSHCPTCCEPLSGLGRYCHVCGEYATRDKAAPEQPRAVVPDTRSEADIRMGIRRALEALGYVVLDLEQGWRRDGSTRVRKGLPDLYVFGSGRHIWAEIKSSTGRLTGEQEVFRNECAREDEPWALWRSEDDAIKWADNLAGPEED